MLCNSYSVESKEFNIFSLHKSMMEKRLARHMVLDHASSLQGTVSGVSIFSFTTVVGMVVGIANANLLGCLCH